MFNWKKNRKTAVADHKKKDNSFAVNNGKKGKEYIMELDLLIGLPDEEFDNAVKGFTIIRNIIAKGQKSASANS